MRAVRIAQIDAFTARPFGGNPAGVVLDADGLSDEEMAAIAREMNLAETAYLLPTSRAGADHRLRWFTPKMEVEFCGHATVATVHAMLAGGRLGDPARETGRVTFDTLVGLLPVTVEQTHEGVTVIWLEPRLAELSECHVPLEPLRSALGLAVEDQDASLPVALTPDKDLVIPCRRLAALRGLRPAMQTLGDLGQAHGLRGVCVTTRETVEPTSTLHSRFFGPHVGIPEDPVTGSVHASLGVYAFTIEAIPRTDGIHRFVAEQGDSLGRPGRLTVEVTVGGGRPTRVRVGGQAVTVLEGTLFLP